MPKRPLAVNSSTSELLKEKALVKQGKTQHASYLQESSDCCGEAPTTTGVAEWIGDHQHMDQEQYDLQQSSRKHNPISPEINELTRCTSLQLPQPCHPKDDDDDEDCHYLSTKPASDSCQCVESDDDEVELLLVIHPPFPKRLNSGSPKEVSPCQGPVSIKDEVNGTEMKGSTPVSSLYKHSASDSSPNERHEPVALWSDEVKNGKHETVDDRNYIHEKPVPFLLKFPPDAINLTPAVPGSDVTCKTEEKSTSIASFKIPLAHYTYRSSAYVQNLAEICHTVLCDRRWRVGPDQQPLFAWESGDDMSAIYALSRLYDDRPPSQGPDTCPCVLCRDDKQATGTFGSTNASVTMYSADDADRAHLDCQKEQALASSADGAETPNANFTQENLSTQEDEQDRSVHLFCRLFYRKGPWFRLDDIYHRYYAPKAPLSKPTTDSGEATDSCEDETVISARGSGLSDSTTFFSQTNSRGSNEKVQWDSVVDQGALACHLSRISDLLADIFCLTNMGLVRSFQDEEECGKVVGSVQIDRRGLLSVSERKHVLTKLGGATGKKPRGLDSNELRPGGANENEIWRQMCQQRSIFERLGVNQPQSCKKSRCLLPVIHHVNEILLDKLAGSVVQACSRVNYIPASTLKIATGHVKSRIHQLLANLQANRVDNKPSTKKIKSEQLDMCIRLREPPTHTLRRCSRLYLCAASGPGRMRGDDGASGWKSLQTVTVAGPIPFSRLVPPPGLDSWHSVVYPGLSSRFGLTSFPFAQVYRKLPMHCRVHEPMEQVFSSRANFRIWELCVELRAQVDYLIELNETALYQERRRVRLAPKDSNDDADASSPREASNTSRLQSSAASLSILPMNSVVDYWGLLTVVGRRHVVSLLTAFDSDESPAVDGLTYAEDQTTEDKVEIAVLNLLGPFEYNSSECNEKKPPNPDRFHSDCERVLAVLAIIIIHVMLRRHVAISKAEASLIASRPWLRHLCWEACLNYMLWDIVPILERRGYHFLSVEAFEVLLFGRLGIPLEPCDGDICYAVPESTFLAPSLLSRRARGKAFERLVLDIQHAIRKTRVKKAGPDQEKLDDSNSQISDQSQKSENSTTAKQLQEALALICKNIIDQATELGSIPFSAIRTLARRLKQPLSQTLVNAECVVEVQELGLRLGDWPAEQSSNDGKPKYSDWVPITDTTVANAMNQEGENSGRCSYVGFEENGDDSATPRSLNVEELAMEYYASGRLPTTMSEKNNDSDELRGGWTGWHDEGGHVRMLFRILCSSIMGVSKECCCSKNDEDANDTIDEELATIHLTPYQAAPFDLHVGFTAAVGSCGFYARRRHTIDQFLQKLSKMQYQELCDLVYDHIATRVDRHNNNNHNKNDAQLERDLSCVRTLSMLAAGFGGQQLAAMFRCLFFDYRHFSGGLPDLLLVRALYQEDLSFVSPTKDDEDAMNITTNRDDAPLGDGIGQSTILNSLDGNIRLVDLGDWIGEEFHPEARAERALQQRASILTDDEFLGCSKVGDSGGSRGGRGRPNSRASTPRPVPAAAAAAGTIQPSSGTTPPPPTTTTTITSSKPPLVLPPRLELQHQERKVVVQCMMVEVKSSNDRLDPRQEDWLNVLDQFGNARVCKFVGNSLKKTTQNKKTKK